MLLLRLYLGCATMLPAGVISGVTLDWASGKPLSRTIVHLRPVPAAGKQIPPRQTRSGRSGQFQFPSVPDGLYILETQREGYLPAAHGQRRTTGHGTPIAVTADSSLFADLRLHRMGALTGTVLDENGIGIPRVSVVAYRAQLPLRVAGRGVSDDRGVYRIAGLELGKHWVRTASHVLDDGTSLLPIFSPEAREPRDALIHEVRFDNDTPDANLRPEPGTLSTLSGTITCDRPPESPVAVTLSSEFQQQTTQTACGAGYTFTALAPGAYEVTAFYPDGSGSAFAESFITQNTQLPLQVFSAQPSMLEVVNAATRAPLRTPVSVLARRDDLSGASPIRELALPRATLPAGHWELAATAGENQYIASISTGSGRDSRRPWRAIRTSDWFPVYLESRFGADRIRIHVADNAGRIDGVVTAEGKAAPGIPVFLWPVKEDVRRMLAGPRQVLSSVQGQYHFAGLPPGEYRLIATMDIREISLELIEESRAKSVTLAAGQSANTELSIWVAP